MTWTQAQDQGWRVRLAAAGVRPELSGEDIHDDRKFASHLATMVRAIRAATLSDEDLYPVLAGFLPGTQPVDWPPHAPALARRCATALASQQPCELGIRSMPTDNSIRMARDAISVELQLKPSDLLALLADHWSTLSGIKMPRSEGRSLLAFAEYVLLEPIAGACALIWSALDPPPCITFARTDEWNEWAPLAGRDWNHAVRIELAHLGISDDTLAEHNGGELLASARAQVLRTSAEPALIAESIVRTSGWPGQPKLIAEVANHAVSLALKQMRISPKSETDTIVAAIRRNMTPGPEVLTEWARDPSVGTLYDYCGDASTGAEMLEEAVSWLTWSLARSAVEVVVALRRSPPLRANRPRGPAAAGASVVAS